MTRSIYIIVLLWIACFIMTSASTVRCLSTDVIYSLCIVNRTNVVVVSKTFSGELLHEECHEHFMKDVFDESCPKVTSRRDTTTLNPSKSAPTSAQRYGYGFLAVVVISVLSLVGLLAVPCLHNTIFQYSLAIFTALAVGTLLGDAIFHLIPFAFGLHSHEGGNGNNHGHDHRALVEGHSSGKVPLYLWRAFAAVIVLYGFYLLEVFLHWITHLNQKSVHAQSHGHSHAMNFRRPNKTDRNDRHDTGKIHESFELDVQPNNRAHQHNCHELDPTLTCATRNCMHHNIFEKSSSHEATNSESITEEASKISRATGWMVILGDGIHNFADGLAIGAAFSQDLKLGLTTTIAVGCHELPHELGDYAVLIQSGFTRCRALMWNFISATTAIIGFFVGTTISTNENARQWIFAITVGMFLYIALVDLLPTLLPHGRIEVRHFICVNIGFLIGIAIMFILAIFEDDLIRSGS